MGGRTPPPHIWHSEAHFTFHATLTVCAVVGGSHAVTSSDFNRLFIQFQWLLCCKFTIVGKLLPSGFWILRQIRLHWIISGDFDLKLLLLLFNVDRGNGAGATSHVHL